MQKCAEAVAVWLVRCQVIEEQEKIILLRNGKLCNVLVANDTCIIIRDDYGGGLKKVFL